MGRIIFILLLLCACAQAKTVVQGTWVSGSNIANQPTVYGIKGEAHADNMPGARYYSVSWTDSNGNLWLFGGLCMRLDLTTYMANDLWKFDGVNWTWVSGSNTPNQVGVYGIKGQADTSNVPGARRGSTSWIDSEDNLWLFGGKDWQGGFNDLWKFDGVNWTWVSGSNIRGQAGVYGTKGQADAANVPGTRERSASWVDADDNLWLFGGYYDVENNAFNDLWKFDGTNWTWVSGSNLPDQPGVYGTKGTPEAANTPGARHSSVSWMDSSGNLRLFGGNSYNDLWKFDGANWTWVGGSNLTAQFGVYGTKGQANPNNLPGGRFAAVSWLDREDNLWLFGGSGYAETTAGKLNDLWIFDGMGWTWMAGTSQANQPGTYGTKGIADTANVPAARMGAVCWTDSQGGMWLFGGSCTLGPVNLFNDLWRFDVYTSYAMEDFNSFAAAWLTETGENNFNEAWDIAVPADGQIDLLDLRVLCEGWLAG